MDMIEIKNTVGDQIQVLDDGTTIADIMKALGWFRKEKERQHRKYKKKYVPNGNPIGRPRLHPVTTVDEPKRPVGRPKKTILPVD